MPKPISQREARALRRQVDLLNDCLIHEQAQAEKARAELEMEKRVSAKVVSEAIAKKEELATALKTERAFTRLRRGQKIAEWRDVPPAVAEACRVAAHLGHVVTFTVKPPERAWEMGPSGSVLLEASEQAPLPADALSIYACERVE